jgi:hypothetical protein
MTKDRDDRISLEAQDARAGRELGVMRYVLQFSIALAVLAGVVIFLLVRP